MKLWLTVLWIAIPGILLDGMLPTHWSGLWSLEQYGPGLFAARLQHLFAAQCACNPMLVAEKCPLYQAPTAYVVYGDHGDTMVQFIEILCA